MVIWKKKKDNYLDLSEKMRKQQEQVESFQTPSSQETPQQEQNQSSGGFFGFFGGKTNAETTQTETTSTNPEERRRKLGKRLIEMTSRIEEQENEIYKLKQRIELLERKQQVGY